MGNSFSVYILNIAHRRFASWTWSLNWTKPLTSPTMGAVDYTLSGVLDLTFKKESVRQYF